MENIKETLQKFAELEEFASARAFELIEAKALNTYGKKQYPFYICNVEPDLHEIEVSFCEKTNHDCPEGGGVTLTIADLELSKNEWDSKIAAIREETQKAKDAKAKKEAEIARKNKLRQLDQLKKELGV